MNVFVKKIHFSWRAVDASGMCVIGKHVSKNLSTLKKELQDKDLTLLSIKQQTDISISFSQKTTKSQSQHNFIREIATLLRTNININHALILLNSAYQQDGDMQSIINTTQQHLEQGISFADALSKQNLFDTITIAMIKTGEQTGTLGNTLIELAQYQEKINKIRSQLLRALSYPLIVLCASLCITLALLLFVVPQFESIFSDFGAQLPLLTRIIVSCANLITQQWYVVLIIVLLSIIMPVFYYRHSSTFQQGLQHALKHTPLISPIINTAMLARWSQMTATTLRAGVPIHQALEATASCIGLTYYQRALETAVMHLKSGLSLQQALIQVDIFPQRIVEMISIGEATGNLDAMFQQITLTYQEQFDSLIENLSKWLEPVIMIILAALIGTIIIAMYLPVFQIGMVV